jgi:hypothetical protein
MKDMHLPEKHKHKSNPFSGNSNAFSGSTSFAPDGQENNARK